MSADTADVRAHRRDALTGALVLLFAALYLREAGSIESSLLSDAVGADGVPRAVGGLMALCGLGLLAKGLWLGRGVAAESGTPTPWRQHGMALALLILLAVYVALLPWLGYLLSMTGLVAAVAWLAGGRERLPVLLMAAITSPLLWLVFDRVLMVRLPTGVWGG